MSNFPFYRSLGSQTNAAQWLPPKRKGSIQDPSNYQADQGLIDACNVALVLSQPILLTGKPGTGKTEFAKSLAWELGLGEVLVFNTKSTSEAQDLFYQYRALDRFKDIQTGIKNPENTLDYIEFGPLGEAIIRTNPELGAQLKPQFAGEAASRAVVLIDEIDKAPRDFPNDILNEIDKFSFWIRELNYECKANQDLRPVLIFTSNSEKDLPDAFLRRCVFYDIPLPNRERLEMILHKRLDLPRESTNPFVQSSIDLFEELQQGDLHKPPSTAELLGFMVFLQGMMPGSENPLEDPSRALQAVGALIKNRKDNEDARVIIEDWIETQETTGEKTTPPPVPNQRQ